MIRKTPPMGFNTFNTFGETYNEQVLKEIADAMVDRGFKDAGYEYVVIDDAWSLEWRDEKTGRIIPRPGKFPNSDILPTLNYIHSKGLKTGIYADVGVKTCGTKVGSFDYEMLDARTFAEWGIDYVKHDNCLKPETQDDEVLYRRMGIALRHCGREMVYSASNWGWDNVWTWIRSCGAHSFRSTGDICDTFDSFVNIFKSQVLKAGMTGPGCFNDLDMLTVGMEGKGNVAVEGDSSHSEAGYRTQFATWCMFSSPLIMGCDVRNVDDKYRDLLCNKELIAIDQDPEARPPYAIAHDDWTTYCKLMSDGTFRLLFINTDENPRKMHFVLHDIGYTTNCGYSVKMTDIFSGEEFIADLFPGVEVPGKDCRLLKAEFVKD